MNDAPVRLFPDYTILVQKQRSSFQAVKCRLHKLHIHYSLLFPAHLQVVDKDSTRFFDSPEDAWDWTEWKPLAT